MAGQLGYADESVWGTAVTVDTFVPVLQSNHTTDEGYLRPAGIRAGRRTKAPGQLGAKTVTGQVRMELPNRPLATLLKQMFGTLATTGIGPYTHTASPGSPVGAGKSLTLQTGITDASDTIRPFTATGVKLTGWELGLSVGEFAMLTFDWSAKDVVTATALAAASYPSDLAPFTFVQGSLTLAGSPVASPRSASVTAAKNLRADRHVLGSRFIREQLDNDLWEFGVSVQADFDDLTTYNAAIAATQLALVLDLDNGTDSLTITANAQVVNAAPSLTRIGLEDQTIELELVSATTDAAAISAVLVNGESAA